MKYHAPTRQFTIPREQIERAAYLLLWAIKEVRLCAGLDLKGYSIEGPMENPHFAEDAILEAAQTLGIDLGSESPGKLDVSDNG